ncbi:MAG: DUF2207 domain-containing protein, partial [Erysipelotrichaceae bacterium]|nr:DUF2207 domain-containing protein [Erysipelotrichaceae bacterium]
MKRLSKIFLSLLIIITAVAGLSRPVNADDGFVIQKHVVEMNVHEDGSILVTETMDVHFYESMHGIYVNIPKEYHMNWTIDGVDYYRTYNFPVIRSKVLSDHKSKIEVYTEGVQIRIGDADKYANMDETYKFQYEIVTRDLDLNGLQMLFMNIVSGKWRAVTNSVEFTIVMPKQFDASKLLFDSPEGVTSVSKGALEFTANGNIIRGSYNEPLAPGEAITVQLMLDNDYFTFPSMDAHGLNSCIISLVVLIAYAVIFYLFGKDDPLVDSVEFHAPAGVNSAEVGVIIDGEANDGDVISLILDWGRRGLLTISDEKDGLKLIKKAEIEATAKGYESHMFDVLFKNRDEVVVDKLKNKFYRTIQHTEKMLDKHFMAKTRQLFTTASKTLQIVLAVLSFLPMGIACLLVSYGYEYDWAMGIFMMCLTAVLIVPVSGIMIYMDNKRYMHRWYVKTLLYLVCAFLFAIAVIILEYL